MQVQVAARENDAFGRDSPIAPLLTAVLRITPQPGLVRDITAAIDEDNLILVSALNWKQGERPELATGAVRIAACGTGQSWE